MSEAATRFVEAADGGEADAAFARAVEAGEAEALAEAILVELSGEKAWLRQRILDRICGVDAAPLLDPLGRALHDAGSPGRRNAARTALAVLARQDAANPDDATEFLETLARADTDADARILSIVALGESRNPAVRETLESLLGDPDSNVAAAVAEALGPVGGQQSVPALLRALEEGAFWVQSAALTTLGRIGDPRAVPTIVEAADDPNLAEPAAAALAEIGEWEGMDGIRRALGAIPESRWEPVLRAAAVLAGNHDDMPIPEWLRDACRTVEDDLVTGFADHPSEPIARLVGIAGTDRAADALLNGLQAADAAEAATIGVRHLPDPLCERVIIEALPEVGAGNRGELLSLLPPLHSNDSLPAVIRLLGDRSADVCTEAGAVLARTGGQAVVEAAEAAAADPERRAGAVHALGLMEELPWPRFLASLQDDDPRVRKAAAHALSRRAAPDSFDALMDAVEREDRNEVLEVLLRAMAAAGGDRAVDHLMARRNEEEAAIRYGAVRALGRTGSERAFDPLVTATEDASRDIRLGALRSLGELGDDRAGPLLVKHLGDTDPDIRRTAAEALAGIATPEAVPALCQSLSDSDWKVRLACVQALARADDEPARSDLARVAKDDPDPLVRKAAGRALQYGDTA